MKAGRPADALIPPGLLAEIEAAAAEEHRPARELVGEAVERYLSERRWFRRDEVHAKYRPGPRIAAPGQGVDGESVMAELIAELDARWLPSYLLSPESQDDLRKSGTIWLTEAVGASRLCIAGNRRAFRLLASHPEAGHFRGDLTPLPIKFWPLFSYLPVFS